jgi:hypothetical protein
MVMVGILVVRPCSLASLPFIARVNHPAWVTITPLGAAVRHVAVHRPSCLPRRRMFWSIKPIISLAVDAAVRHVAAGSALLPATATDVLEHRKRSLSLAA